MPERTLADGCRNRRVRPGTLEHSRRALAFAIASSLALLAVLSPPLARVAHASTLPANFQESIVFSGLDHPTAVRFASDGRVFVAEKSGVIKVFASLMATRPTVFANLSLKVDNYWDRGLLGLALDPNFPTTNPFESRRT